MELLRSCIPSTGTVTCKEGDGFIGRCAIASTVRKLGLHSLVFIKSIAATVFLSMDLIRFLPWNGKLVYIIYGQLADQASSGPTIQFHAVATEYSFVYSTLRPLLRHSATRHCWRVLGWQSTN